MSTAAARPSHAALSERQGQPPGSAWGLSDAYDRLGSVANITEERVKAAVSTVKFGKSYGLDYAVNAFDPPTSPARRRASHQMYTLDPALHRDDYLDSFYLQSTSQIDGLRHARHPTHGFFNNVEDSQIIAEGGPLGIDLWSESGIAGRGVVVDIDRHLQATRGHSLDHAAGEAFETQLVDEALEAQGTTLMPGDLLLLHTGWCEYYFGLDDGGRAAIPGNVRSPGLAQSQATVAWLWDSEISVVATDNVAVEAIPVVADSAFPTGPAGAMMHPVLIGLLGLCLGELWKLDELAAACAADGRYECLLTAKPLNVRGGAGSPPNAIAIR